MMVKLKPLDASELAHTEIIPMKHTERSRNRMPELDEMSLNVVAAAGGMVLPEPEGGRRRG